MSAIDQTWLRKYMKILNHSCTVRSDRFPALLAYIYEFPLRNSCDASADLAANICKQIEHLCSCCKQCDQFLISTQFKKRNWLHQKAAEVGKWANEVRWSKESSIREMYDERERERERETYLPDFARPTLNPKKPPRAVKTRLGRPMGFISLSKRRIGSIEKRKK